VNAAFKRLFRIALLLLPLNLFSLGRGDKPLKGDIYDQAAAGALVEITGIIRLTGSEPFSGLLISDEYGHDWHLDQNAKAVFLPYQHHTITIRGRLELVELRLADGVFLGVRRIIVDPMIAPEAP
jgi:hypothetical protein